MKNLIIKWQYLFFVFFNLNSSFGQSLIELKQKKDSFEIAINQLDSQIQKLEKQKDNLKRQIIDINCSIDKIELNDKINSGIEITINSLGGKLRREPSIAGEELINFLPGDTIILLNWYKKPFFKARYKDFIGYISYSSINNNQLTNRIINKDIIDTKLKSLIEEFGESHAKKIFRNEFWLGMTDKMAEKSLGIPTKINRTTGSWGIHEQWIYQKEKLYLYFENGILSSFQN